MKRKSFYVVTETIVIFERESVDTFIKGISEQIDSALSVLEFSKKSCIKAGFDKSLISDFEWGWAYKSDSCIIKDEINIKFL